MVNGRVLLQNTGKVLGILYDLTVTAQDWFLLESSSAVVSRVLVFVGDVITNKLY